MRKFKQLLKKRQNLDRIDELSAEFLNNALEIRQLTPQERFDDIESDTRDFDNARKALHKCEYEEAIKFCMKSIKETFITSTKANLLGKTLMASKQYDMAIKCFEMGWTCDEDNLEKRVFLPSHFGDKIAQCKEHIPA